MYVVCIHIICYMCVVTIVTNHVCGLYTSYVLYVCVVTMVTNHVCSLLYVCVVTIVTNHVCGLYTYYMLYVCSYHSYQSCMWFVYILYVICVCSYHGYQSCMWFVYILYVLYVCVVTMVTNHVCGLYTSYMLYVCVVTIVTNHVCSLLYVCSYHGLPIMYVVCVFRSSDPVKCSHLVDIIHTMWFTLLGDRDDRRNDIRLMNSTASDLGDDATKHHCLPVLFTNQIMLILLDLILRTRQAKTCVISWKMSPTLYRTFDDANTFQPFECELTFVQIFARKITYQICFTLST